MSQKNDKKEEASVKDKWREMAENTSQDEETRPQDSVENDNLLDDESSSSVSKDKINLLEKQIETYRDQAARAQAELANSLRRLEQEVAKARKFGSERVISELLPIVDSLVHGLENTSSGDSQAKSMREGMELTLDLLNKLLEKNGVLVIDPKIGDVFDPTQQEAMSMRSEPKATQNTVLQVLQKGYALHGRVIRAAMVIVAA